MRALASCLVVHVASWSNTSEATAANPHCWRAHERRQGCRFAWKLCETLCPSIAQSRQNHGALRFPRRALFQLQWSASQRWWESHAMSGGRFMGKSHQSLWTSQPRSTRTSVGEEATPGIAGSPTQFDGSAAVERLQQASERLISIGCNGGPASLARDVW